MFMKENFKRKHLSPTFESWACGPVMVMMHADDDVDDDEVTDEDNDDTLSF